jgi:lipopolysaccharide/colanic/teichoic acid biosynthesis glycosyltransferase
MLDLMFAAVAVVFLLPVFAILALLILLYDGRPVLFGHTRVGRYGRTFRIWKFRTMREGVRGSNITAAGDARVTAIGARLRRLKLDELPQLFNVLRGDMSLIGPRPETPEYVNFQSAIWNAVLQVRPGITDVATLLYRNEEILLAASGDSDRLYREAVLPSKLLLSLAYLRTRSFLQDSRLLWLTMYYSLSPERFDPVRVRDAFGVGNEYAGYLYSLSSAFHR